MALDKATLKTSVKAAFLAALGSTTAEEDLAQALADAIDTFVKSGTVDPAGGPPPLTAPAGGGAVTGTGVIT